MNKKDIVIKAKDIISNKFKNVDIPAMDTAIVSFSGGTDSTLIVAMLKNAVYKVKNIYLVYIDVGEGPTDIANAKMKARYFGLPLKIIDAKKELSEKWLPFAIWANSDYQGYPVSTCITRHLIAKHISIEAEKIGANAIFEGASGKGNDQFRKTNVYAYFIPDATIIYPVRDFDLTREEEEILTEYWKIPLTEVIKGGNDTTVWANSIGSGAIGLETNIPDNVWTWLVPPKKAPDKGTVITLEFKQGLPIKLNKKNMSLFDLIWKLDEIAGKNGVGYIDMFEDQMLNLKSREIFEAPGATVILKAHKDLEGMCLTKQERLFKTLIEEKWAYHIYHGDWFHPLIRALEAFTQTMQQAVEGILEIELYKGNVTILKRYSKNSLFRPDIRGLHTKSFDQRLNKGVAIMNALQYKILAEREKKL